VRVRVSPSAPNQPAYAGFFVFIIPDKNLLRRPAKLSKTDPVSFMCLQSKQASLWDQSTTVQKRSGRFCVFIILGKSLLRRPALDSIFLVRCGG
jgi:hypothetical protein